MAALLSRTRWLREQEDIEMDPMRRKILATGAAATAMAAVESAFGQQAGTEQSAAPMKFYEKGKVKIHYEEWGSGFPVLLLPGGGLSSTINSLRGPFPVVDELKGEYRVIASDLRNAGPGHSIGPLEPDRKSTRLN